MEHGSSKNIPVHVGTKVVYMGIEALVYKVNRPIGFTTKPLTYCLEINDVEAKDFDKIIGDR